MDANGTLYKAVLGKENWQRWLIGAHPLGQLWQPAHTPVPPLAWDTGRNELTLTPQAWRFPPPKGARSIRLEQRRGAAADRYGNWYVIDQDERAINVLSSGSAKVSRFWPQQGQAPSALAASAANGNFVPVQPPTDDCPALLRGLTVTEDHYLLVGELGEASGILVFDLRSGGPPMKLTWPRGTDFAPYDLAARAGGGAFVLDRTEGERRPRVWRLDRQFRVESLARTAAAGSPRPEPSFVPLDGAPPAHGTAAGAETTVRGDDAVFVPAGVIAIDVAGDDIVVLLQRFSGGRSSALLLFDPSVTELAESPRTLSLPDRPLKAHDMAVMRRAPADPTDVVGYAYVADEQGDQVYRFALSLKGGGELRPEPEFLPMRLFGGKAIVATADGIWYDFADHWIRLEAQRRPSYAETARIESPIFDSGQPGAVWHRLLLDACIPDETSISVSSVASDDPDLLLDAPAWMPEPMPYRRGDGPERPYVPRSTDLRYGTYELLFQAARGRYMRLRLEWSGNRRATPRLRALRAYYPRFSYLEHYLPGVYRIDRESASFMDAFLANFEGFYTALEDKIGSVQVLFDPAAAPAEVLDWLASWFEVVLDPGWDDDRRRLFLQHAVELFRWRGTRRGLRMALGLALLTCPDDRLFALEQDELEGIRIVERFATKRLTAIAAGDPSGSGLPRVVTDAPRWRPEDGRSRLNARWSDYTAALLPILADDHAALPVSFPILAPQADVERAWRAFAQTVLGFVPSATSRDQARWSKFLARRYPRIGDLNSAYARGGSTAFTSFDDAAVPTSLPVDGRPLVDWYEFESIVMPGVRAAHRFSVLLPVPTGRAHQPGVVRAADPAGRLAEERRVQRLVDLEKPAHTVFDIRSYWLAFRVGEARVGQDTLLDYGSRSLDLRPPAVLGSLEVGSGVLTSDMDDTPERPAVFSGSVDAQHRRVRRTHG